MKKLNNIEAYPIKIKTYTVILMLLWTVIVFGSLLWNVYQVKQGTLDMAHIQARSAFMKDVLYRRWNTSHGGVYAPVSEQTVPNPHLDESQRDITAHSGLVLTLINPAYMTRQVHELATKIRGIQGHITSLNPLSPTNTPDPWESQALQAFQRGVKEESRVEKIKDKSQLRFMQPLLTEEGCLKCHNKQGYQVGDIQGGISISVPLSPLLLIERSQIVTLSLGHVLLCLIGLMGLGIGTLRLSKQITDRKKAEKALREKTKYIDSILYSSTDMAIIATDLNLHIVYCNPVAEIFFGYKSKEVLGLPVMELYSQNSEDSAQFERGIEIVKTEGEYKYCIAQETDSGVRHLDSQVTGIFGKDNDLIGFLLRSTDITERIQNMEALANSKRLWEDTFNAVQDYIAVHDREYRIMNANKALLDKLGLTREELVGRRCYELIHGTSTPTASCPHKTVMQSQKPHVVELYEESLGGDILVNCYPIFNDSGEFFGSVHVVKDISESKRAENKLKESERRFRELFEHTPIAYQSLDRLGRFTDINSIWLDMLGYDKEEVVGRSFGEFWSEATKDLFEGYFKTLKAERIIDNAELALKKKDGQQLEVLITGRVQSDPAGNFLRTHCILFDITARKKTEQEIKNYARMQSVLVKEINHRVKNNLFAIQGMINAERYRAGEDGKEILERLGDRVLGLSTVHNMLARVEWHPIMLSELCKEITGGIFAGSSGDTKVNCLVKSSTCKVASKQAHQIAMLVNELATNSLKYGLGGRNSMLVTIEIEEHRGKMISLVYRDDGPGYPEEKLRGAFFSVSVGMDIILSIVEKNLQGEMTLRNDNGAVCEINNIKLVEQGEGMNLANTTKYAFLP